MGWMSPRVPSAANAMRIPAPGPGAGHRAPGHRALEGRKLRSGRNNDGSGRNHDEEELLVAQVPDPADLLAARVVDADPGTQALQRPPAALF